jgi:hypothetical protein
VSECVILIRMGSGKVSFVSDSEDTSRIHVFADRDAAIEESLAHPLLQVCPHQIVELDEL